MPELLTRTLGLFAVLLATAISTEAQGTVPPRAEAVTQGSNANPNVGMAAVENSSIVVDPDRKLQPGDQVSVSILEDNEPAPALKAISAAGDVDISPLGSVKVAGMTAAQASGAIKRFLEGDYYYKATVRLSVERVNRAASMGTIYLSGEVNGVGPQPIYAERQLMLSQAILNAGGFKKFADSRSVRVTRTEHGAPQTYKVDIKQVIERGKTDLDMELRDGDRIFVPEAFFKH